MKEIFKKFNIEIKNEDLLRVALTHSSYSNEHGCECYERLEYLGDAVLEIVISDYLYKERKYEECNYGKNRSRCNVLGGQGRIYGERHARAVRLRLEIRGRGAAGDRA